MQGGQEVACYEVGPDGLSADDVAGATASLDRGTGRWQVDFTLTGPGAAHFDSVARSMGPGRQLAIVLDGRLLSAPTLLTASPPMTGTVTGLDEQAARSLADRLGK
jgi:preprotein translocase subunit SecD